MDHRIVVVLGMHRSGTSTVSRGLRVLGVDLGDKLLPPAPGDNERGYWEDADIHALNMELLLALGHDWHTLEPVTQSLLEGPVAARFEPRALELLRGKTRGRERFGLKDPRISRLLPFWKRIFRETGVEASYVVVSRNPLSVARSLAKRDGFEPVKCHYLWLEHMLTSLLESAGARRVVVDYDLFMDDLEGQFRRIARGLALPFDPSGAEFREFRDGFLVESMRHTRFSPEDLRRDPSVPKAVASLFETLEGMASDRIDPDGPLVQPLLSYLVQLQRDLVAGLAYMREFEERATNLGRALAESEGRARELDHRIGERDSSIARQAAEAAESEARIATLGQAVAGREAELADLARRMAGREAELFELRGRLAGREAELDALRRELEGRAARIDGLDAAIRNRDDELSNTQGTVRAAQARIDALLADLASREAELASLRAGLHELRTSYWQVPRPARVARVLRAHIDGRGKPTKGER